MLLLLVALFAPAWGDASNGVAMRVERAGSELRAHFRTVGPTPAVFAIGAATGSGQMMNFDITAKQRRGRTCRLLHTAFGFVGGHVEPVVMRLGPGKEDYVSIAIDKLRCVEPGHESAVRHLFAREYSVLVSFTATTEGNSWARLPAGSWTGTVRSGEIP